MDFLKFIESNELILLDGAMGTELDKRGLMSCGRNNLDAQDGPMAEKIKFYNAATECMQNISHLSMFENERNVGTLSMGKSEKGYVVNSLNPINDATKGELNSLLQQIGKISSTEIEAIINDRIKAGTLPLTSSAAQSFIDLARVANEWEFSFEILEMLPMQFFYKVFI